MSDLDQLLDTLVADVRSQTRAPGAPKAIAQARRRRNVVVSAGAVAAVAVLAAGSALAAGTLLGGGERSSLAGIPTASPEPPDDAHLWSPGAVEEHRALRKTLTSVPGWSITAGGLRGPLTVLDRCVGSWGVGVVASGDHPGPYVPPSGFAVYFDERKVRNPAAASESQDQIVESLLSCTAESWRTQPIGQTGAVLAFTDAAVVWILHKEVNVSVLHVATTDGPPPLAVQVEVANQMHSWMK